MCTSHILAMYRLSICVDSCGNSDRVCAVSQSHCSLTMCTWTPAPHSHLPPCPHYDVSRYVRGFPGKSDGLAGSSTGQAVTKHRGTTLVTQEQECTARRGHRFQARDRSTFVEVSGVDL